MPSMIITNVFMLRGYVYHCKFGKVFLDFNLPLMSQEKACIWEYAAHFHPTTCCPNAVRRMSHTKTHSEGSMSRHEVLVFSDIFS